MNSVKGFLVLMFLAGFLLIPVRGSAYHFSYPTTVSRQPQATVKLEVPYHKQEHKLSCEAATLRMVLLYRGIDEPEDVIIAKTPLGSMGSDPDLVFVGNIDGVQNRTGYGIHWDGVAQVAKNYGLAESFHRRDLHFLIDRLHDGQPVIIWGSMVRSPGNVSWTTDEGKYIHAVRGEHTWVVTGYAGPRRAPTHIFMLDPLSGERVFQTQNFLDLWSHYHNSGVFLK